MLSLEKNLCGKHFDEYIEVCASLADTFSLTKNGWEFECEEAERQRILALLAPFYIRTMQTEHWFCQRVPVGYEKEVYLFNMTEESKQILLSEYRSVFYESSVWSKPEDLCFFKKNKLFSGSLTHEKICYVYDYETIFSEKVTLPNAWEMLPSNLAEQIILPE
mgnify:CR=1 FL=1